MAGIFETNVGGPQASPITARATPVDTSGAIEANVASSIVSGVGSALVSKARSDAVQARSDAVAQQKVAANTVVGNFLQGQLTVADAVASGAISSKEGAMRLRSNLSQSLADNPSFSKDIQSAHGSIVTSTGGAKIVGEGTEAEKQAIKKVNAADDAGWIPDGTAPADIPILVEDYFDFKNASAELEFSTKQLAFTQANVNLTKSQLALETAVRTDRVEKALVAVGSTYSRNFNTQLNDIQARWEAGELKGSEAEVAINNAYQVIEEQVRSAGQGSGGNFISAIVDPMTTRKDDLKELVSGAIEKTFHETQKAIAIGQQQVNMLLDPFNLVAASASGLYKNTDIITQAGMTDRVATMLRQAEDKLPVNVFNVDPQDKQAQGVRFDVIKDNMTRLSSGNMVRKDITEGQLKNQVVNVMDSIVAFGPQATSAEDMTPLISFIASPEFGVYTTRKGGIPAESTPQARAIIAQQYEKVVIPLITEEFETAQDQMKAVTRRGRRGDKLLQAVFRGAGVTFITTDPTDSGSVSVVRRLNATISPILNRIIRMSAHLDGNRNYQAEYEKNYAPLFNAEVGDDTTQVLPSPTPKPPVEGNGDETLIANGFSEPMLNLLSDEERGVFSG